MLGGAPRGVVGLVGGEVGRVDLAQQEREVPVGRLHRRGLADTDTDTDTDPDLAGAVALGRGLPRANPDCDGVTASSYTAVVEAVADAAGLTGRAEPRIPQHGWV